MKLESLKGIKFEQLSDEAMAFIVGGANVQSFEKEIDTSHGCVKISNDYKDGSGVLHYGSGPGNDLSDRMMTAALGEGWNGISDPEDPLYPEWMGMSTGVPCVHQGE